GRAAHAASEARPGVVVCESAEDRGFLAGILDQQETRPKVRHRPVYERCRNGVCSDGTDEGVAGDGPLCPRANEPDTVSVRFVMAWDREIRPLGGGIGLEKRPGHLAGDAFGR